MATQVEAGIGRARHDEVLVLLCGDVLRRSPPSRQPPIVRAGAAVGLELLDLLLNPEHVLRVTEELTLRNSLVLARQVTIDISLDRMSRQQEDGAAQLSALISDRVSLGAERSVGGANTTEPAGGQGPTQRSGRLWVPLDTVPRPVSVPVEVTALDGTALPRPTQREVVRALEAALYHVLRESLRVHPDFDRDGTPINLVMRRDAVARWLLQSALLALSQVPPSAAHWDACESEVRRRLDGVDLADLVGDERRAAIKVLADKAGLPSRQQALLVIGDALSEEGPFLDLLRLVHNHYFVVVGLDPSQREQSVHFDLPESEALDGSVATQLAKSTRRSFDPREHNYTVHVWVPLPDNVREYSLPVSVASADGARSHSEVSLIAAIHFDDHPGRPAIDALLTCAEELESGIVVGDHDEDVTSGGDVATPDASAVSHARAMRIGFVARRATTAVDRLDTIVERQEQAADEWADRWGRASTWTVRRSIERVRAVAKAARDELTVARSQLQQTVADAEQRRVTSGRLERAAAAVRSATRAADRRLLRTRLVSNELAGQDVARIRLGQSTMFSRSGPRPRELEVWATVSDEAVPFGYTALGPPLGLALFLCLTGRLLFDSWWWMWPPYILRLPPEVIDTGGPDAMVAVLLLIPAFAVTQFRVPDRWSVAGRLRRPARLFVLVAIVTLGAIAMIVATQVGTDIDDPSDGHPHLVLWAFRGAVGLFTLWSVWAFSAWRCRHKHAWRPKGLKSHFGPDALVRVGPPSRRARRARRWLSGHLGWLVQAIRSFRYDNKEPDAEFDLRLPTRSFPSRPPRRWFHQERS